MKVALLNREYPREPRRSVAGAGRQRAVERFSRQAIAEETVEPHRIVAA